MPNPYFQFKQFTVYHDRCAMKVTTDSCVFGAWVAKELLNEKRRPSSVLDIGSGTGLLALMIAQKNELTIDAVEIDKEAAGQSKQNVAASPWEQRIDVINEDIREFRPGKKYDCIVSNPPFYENELASESQRNNLAHHSEQLTMSEVITTIHQNLEDDGVFYLMLPFKREKELKQLLKDLGLHLLNVITLKQSVRHGPFRLFIKGGNRKQEEERSTTISIWDEKQQYTESFVDLLKDYYLYL